MLACLAAAAAAAAAAAGGGGGRRRRGGGGGLAVVAVAVGGEIVSRAIGGQWQAAGGAGAGYRLRVVIGWHDAGQPGVPDALPRAAMREEGGEEEEAAAAAVAVRRGGGKRARGAAAGSEGPRGEGPPGEGPPGGGGGGGGPPPPPRRRRRRQRRRRRRRRRRTAGVAHEWREPEACDRLVLAQLPSRVACHAHQLANAALALLVERCRFDANVRIAQAPSVVAQVAGMVAFRRRRCCRRIVVIIAALPPLLRSRRDRASGCVQDHLRGEVPGAADRWLAGLPPPLPAAVVVVVLLLLLLLLLLALPQALLAPLLLGRLLLLPLFLLFLLFPGRLRQVADVDLGPCCTPRGKLPFASYVDLFQAPQCRETFVFEAMAVGHQQPPRAELLQRCDAGLTGAPPRDRGEQS